MRPRYPRGSAPEEVEVPFTLADRLKLERLWWLVCALSALSIGGTLARLFSFSG